MEAVLTSMAVEILAPVAAAALTALVSWALAELARYVRRKTSNEAVNAAITRLSHTAATTVAELEQDLVPAFRRRAADGKLTPHDRAHLKSIALNRIKKRLTPAVQHEAGRAIADIDSFLRAKIEQAVHEMKRGEYVYGEVLPLAVDEAAR